MRARNGIYNIHNHYIISRGILEVKDVIPLEVRIEYLGGGVRACVSKEHSFSTDSLLLANFSAPRSANHACDLCSGSGIIPLLWFRGGGPVSAAAVDVQSKAVELIKRSTEINELEHRLTPVLSDLRELKGVLPAGAFDLVTCNPPYKAAGTGVLSMNTSDRIARHEMLCTLEDCCAAASRLLRFGGRFCLCQLTERLPDVFEAMRRNKLEPKRVRFVQKDKNNAPRLVLVEGRRGSKPFLRADPTLMIYEDGEFSEEMREICGEYRFIPKI